MIFNLTAIASLLGISLLIWASNSDIDVGIFSRHISAINSNVNLSKYATLSYIYIYIYIYMESIVCIWNINKLGKIHIWIIIKTIKITKWAKIKRGSLEGGYVKYF